jgi:hypothetical protein
VIQVRLFFCSDSSAIDGRRNTISAFHIVENLWTPIFPIAIPSLSVIALLTRDQTDQQSVEYQLQVHLGGQQLLSHPLRASFLQQATARVIAEIHGLVVPAPGTLSFSAREGDQIKASWAVLVQQATQGQVQLHFPPPPIPSASVQ